jgi:hypothetical protein
MFSDISVTYFHVTEEENSENIWEKITLMK